MSGKIATARRRRLPSGSTTRVVSQCPDIRVRLHRALDTAASAFREAHGAIGIQIDADDRAMHCVSPSVASSGLRERRYRSPGRREAQPLPATTQPAQRLPATRRKSAPTRIAKVPAKSVVQESPSWRRLGAARAAGVNQSDGRCSAPRSALLFFASVSQVSTTVSGFSEILSMCCSTSHCASSG
jgi:hypothetical protein